jgi:hypothetical protein
MLTANVPISEALIQLNVALPNHPTAVPWTFSRTQAVPFAHCMDDDLVDWRMRGDAFPWQIDAIVAGKGPQGGTLLCFPTSLARDHSLHKRYLVSPTQQVNLPPNVIEHPLGELGFRPKGDAFC